MYLKLRGQTLVSYEIDLKRIHLLIRKFHQILTEGIYSIYYMLISGFLISFCALTEFRFKLFFNNRINQIFEHPILFMQMIYWWSWWYIIQYISNHFPLLCERYKKIYCWFVVIYKLYIKFYPKFVTLFLRIGFLFYKDFTPSTSFDVKITRVSVWLFTCRMLLEKGWMDIAGQGNRASKTDSIASLNIRSKN